MDSRKPAEPRTSLLHQALVSSGVHSPSNPNPARNTPSAALPTPNADEPACAPLELPATHGRHSANPHALQGRHEARSLLAPVLEHGVVRHGRRRAGARLGTFALPFLHNPHPADLDKAMEEKEEKGDGGDEDDQEGEDEEEEEEGMEDEEEEGDGQRNVQQHRSRLRAPPPSAHHHHHHHQRAPMYGSLNEGVSLSLPMDIAPHQPRHHSFEPPPAPSLLPSPSPPLPVLFPLLDTPRRFHNPVGHHALRDSPPLPSPSPSPPSALGGDQQFSFSPSDTFLDQGLHSSLLAHSSPPPLPLRVRCAWLALWDAIPLHTNHGPSPQPPQHGKEEPRHEEEEGKGEQQQEEEDIDDEVEARGGLAPRHFPRLTRMTLPSPPSPNPPLPLRECSICIDVVAPGQDCTLLECGHLFHTGCIRGCFVGDHRCPNCRMDVRLGPQPRSPHV